MHARAPVDARVHFSFAISGCEPSATLRRPASRWLRARMTVFRLAPSSAKRNFSRSRFPRLFPILFDDSRIRQLARDIAQFRNELCRVSLLAGFVFDKSDASTRFTLAFFFVPARSIALWKFKLASKRQQRGHYRKSTPPDVDSRRPVSKKRIHIRYEIFELFKHLKPSAIETSHERSTTRWAECQCKQKKSNKFHFTIKLSD